MDSRAGVGVLIIRDKLDFFPHVPGIRVRKVALYLQGIVVFGRSDAFFEVASDCDVGLWLPDLKATSRVFSSRVFGSERCGWIFFIVTVSVQKFMQDNTADVCSLMSM